MGKREEKQKAAALCGYRKAGAGESQCRDCLYSSQGVTSKLECYNSTAMRGHSIGKLNTCDRAELKKGATARVHGGARKGAGAPKLPPEKRKEYKYDSASIRVTGKLKGWTGAEVKDAAIWAIEHGYQR